jgi:hypothetical protein
MPKRNGFVSLCNAGNLNSMIDPSHARRKSLKLHTTRIIDECGNNYARDLDETIALPARPVNLKCRMLKS